MQLPVDVKALIDEMTNINSARSVKLSVSIYIDNAAPADLTARVRAAFVSSLPTVRLTLSYLDSSFAPHKGDDMAIIVAGTSRAIGAAAAAIRAAGIPVMVASTSPATIARIATDRSHPIPEADIVAPCMPGEDEEPIELDEEMGLALDARMGAWVVAACHEKRLAFSIAFPFMRRPLAKDAVAATSLQNAGIGLVPFIPGADLPIMTLNQGKMALQIAAAYGQEMNKDRAKELAAVVGGAYVCRTLARELAEFIPVLGIVVKPGIAYGGTAAIGNAIIEYYEGGQNAAGVANVASRAAGFANKWITKFRDDPAEVVSEARSKVSETVPVVREKVEVVVPKVRDFVTEYGPKAKDVVVERVPKAKELVEEYGPKAKDAASAYAPKIVDTVTDVVSSAFSGDDRSKSAV